MSRIIKARVWDEENKIMVYPDEFGNYEFKVRGRRVRKDVNVSRMLMGHYRELTPMQFTGLVEVYEADICRTDVNGKVWVVRWGNYGWELINHQIKEPKHRMACDEQYSFQKYLQILKKASATIQVIGNIYSNPELVKP